MMRFDYDANFVEQATFLAAKDDAQRESLLHERLDPLYRIGDVELRQRAFREAHAELFERFGLGAFLPRVIGEFRLVSQHVPYCIVREAERKRAQSVDLYIQRPSREHGDGNQTLSMVLCSSTVLDVRRMTPWLRRQIQHIEDMVDECFAYDTGLPCGSVVQQNLVRDRYAVLWDMYVEGRLLRSGRLEESAATELWSSFAKAFTHEGQCPLRETFDQLMEAEDLRHAVLLRWASAPGTVGKGAEGGTDASNRGIGACAVG